MEFLIHERISYYFLIRGPKRPLSSGPPKPGMPFIRATTGHLACAGKQESIKPGDGISIESSESGVWVAAVVLFLPVVSGYQSI